MKLSSPAFTQNSKIPSKYTCDGDNINPELEIENVPIGAKSLVLIMDDPDIPTEIKKMRGIEVFDHWVVFNIDPNTTKIYENSLPENIGNGTVGKNSRGEDKYTGPCPPPQYLPKEHRYFFKLYAIDKMLDITERATKKEVEEAIEGHVLAKAELIGKYEKNA
ncbi:YbhB/YbcL family Raf kinase inhibitor-like protein [Candidatus Woesearchaeota archaeon]|nr:YbhB/YbcL family Raf kinase inhibitor-like protein [Candidatus Woesearchaeota archaeon]